MMVKLLSPWLTLVARFLETPHIYIYMAIIFYLAAILYLSPILEVVKMSNCVKHYTKIPKNTFHKEQHSNWLRGRHR